MNSWLQLKPRADSLEALNGWTVYFQARILYRDDGNCTIVKWSGVMVY